MTLEAIPTTPEHIKYFESQEVGLDVKITLSDCMNSPTVRPMMSFMDGDYVVFVCGLSFISEGVWEAWLIPSKRLHNYAKATVRAMREFTDWLLTDYPAHRIQIAVLQENKKWAESIGFQFESIVKKYHRGLDHFMYVKVGE
jgi:hypothetical protein